MATVLRTNFTNGEIAPSLEGQVDLKKLYNSVLRMENFNATVHGPAEFRQGTTFNAETKDSSGESLLIPFQFNNDQTYSLEFGAVASGAGYLRVFHAGGQVLASNGNPYEIASPYARSTFTGIYYQQIKDVLVLACHEVAPHTLSRTGHDSWTFAECDFAPDTPTPGTPTGAVTNPEGTATTSCTYSAAAVSEKGEGLAATSAAISRPLVLDDTHYVTLTIPRASNASSTVSSYVVYRNDGNADGYVGYVKQPTSGDATFADKGAKTPDLSDSPLPARNPFVGAGNYPSVCSVHQNRTAWANTDNDPGLLQLSRTGAYFDLRKHELTDPLDNDAIELAITSTRRDAIVGLVSRRQLLVLTEGGGGVVSGGSSGNDILTPANCKYHPEGTDGGASAMPMLAGNAALFIHSALQTIMEMAYRYDSDSFPTNDMTLLAPHMGRESSFKQLALVQTPAKVVYALREDGVLIGMVYERGQDIVGLYRVVTDGEVKSICAIYDSMERRDQLWMCVKRTIAGVGKYFIEILPDRFDGETVADGCFLDCSLTYDGRNTDATKLLTLSGASYSIGDAVALTASGHSPFAASNTGLVYSLQLDTQSGYDVEAARYRVRLTSNVSSTVHNGALLDAVPAAMQSNATPNWALLATSLSGLDHLANHSVTISADGMPQPEQVVTSGGSITVSIAASVIHAGLPYDGLLIPTRVEGGSPDGGTQQTKVQRISEVGVRFYKSIGAEVGTDEDDENSFEPIYQDPDGRLGGAPPKLFTGDKIVKVRSGWNRKGLLVIRQTQPLPCTVLLLAVKEQVIP